MRQMTLMLDKSLNSIFTEIAINPRAWQVLEARVDQSLTLEETGKRFGGVSRERVRQIESKAKAKFLSQINIIAPIFDVVEPELKGKSSAILRRVGVTGAQGERVCFATKIQKILESNSWKAETADVQQLILLVRAIVLLKPNKGRKSIVEKNWPRLAYYACSLPPAIFKNTKVAKQARHSLELRRKLPYKDIAIRVLKDAGEPLHWRIIAERGYQLRNSHSFSTAAVYNVLQSHSDTFVRVGHGTYALVEWGIGEADYYPDIISSILEDEKRSLSLDMIYSRVNLIRPAKRQTISMFLDMHPRFYKSIEGTYGVRSWLPPREKQTLRTPEWLVEDSSSFMRVERAIEKGYKLQLQQDSDAE